MYWMDWSSYLIPYTKNDIITRIVTIRSDVMDYYFTDAKYFACVDGQR